ncbi:HET-domain-containing protein [Hypoxylon trugodes]|uniref:HET-domain-containing protein n=1 Tax=Hypoxylon trugodes TaxID=326681 RepID=UPI00218DFA4F|nr:HET-domain-containing protein [Hypoxylon trugodes]KAI1384811.1 HET-domain-containing protein [Hypoxylon trugodes]
MNNMASTGIEIPEKVCSVCDRILWFELQPEDVLGTPHHTSRRNLEASAKSCRLCDLVLHAAIANYKDSRGRRNGKGYWRQFNAVKYHDGTSVRDITYVKELGACMPVSATDYNMGVGRAVLAATGNIANDGMHVDDEREIRSLETLDINEDETTHLPVWLYGNWWAEYKPSAPGDTAPLRLMGVGARFGKTQSHLDALNNSPNQISLRGSYLGICTTDDGLFNQIPGRLREINSDSDIAFNRLEKWLKHCELNHPYCGRPQSNPVLPTRVIDVFASNRGVSVVETHGRRGQYVTLSHCWGTSSRLTANKESIKDLGDGIAVSFLPKTFQDAIKITRRLGIKYLWIDCLCIVQDDPDDWEREASVMSQVYRYSYLTISADASKDSYTGCFPKREKDSYISPATMSLGYTTPREATGPRSHSLAYEHTSQPGKKNSVYLFEEWLPGSSFHFPQRMGMNSFGKRFDPIADEPLSTRAWTLQERLLSPRIIHYAHDQMYFECETCMNSEDGFTFSDIYFGMKRLLDTQCIPHSEHGLPQSSGISFIVGQDAGGKSPGIRWQGGWLSLVENYMMRNLTVSRDKLTALAGVARAVAEETGDRYYAGLWARHFMEDLYWRTYQYEEIEDRRDMKITPIKGKRIGTIRKPTEYRAPSWSWASLDGPVKHLPLSYSNLVSRIIGCSTTPAGKDPYGRVSGGKLDIEGPIYEVRPHQPKGRWDRHGIPVEIDLEDDRGISIGALNLDLPDEPISCPCYALFLDPSRAIILQTKEFEPKRNEDGTKDPNTLVSKPILTTCDVNRSIAGDPKMKGFVFQALFEAVRIGAGIFVKSTKKELDQSEDEEKEPELWDEAKHGKLTLDKILHVSGDQTWGPITKDDPKVWVTIV